MPRIVPTGPYLPTGLTEDSMIHSRNRGSETSPPRLIFPHWRARPARQVLTFWDTVTNITFLSAQRSLGYTH